MAPTADYSLGREDHFRGPSVDFFFGQGVRGSEVEGFRPGWKILGGECISAGAPETHFGHRE